MSHPEVCAGCDHPIPSWCHQCKQEYGCGELGAPCELCGEPVLGPNGLTYPGDGDVRPTGNGHEVVRA